MAAATRFSEDAWSQIRGLFAKIVEHPFNQSLADGSLSRERFERYVLEDAHYLTVFTRALAATAARAGTDEDRGVLLRNAHESVQIERDLHRRMLADFGITRDKVRSFEPSPTGFAYGNFLLALAFGEPYPVAVAGLLPCFRIYWEVGKALAVRSAALDPARNPYRAWIDTYAGEEYAATVAEVAELVDRAAQGQTPTVRDQMMKAYLKASELEWMFWDSAWSLETWPVRVGGRTFPNRSEG